MFAAMDGLMMDARCSCAHIAERAEQLFGDREIVSRTHDGVERSTYAEVVERARRLAVVAAELGVKPGDRVATFGWNSRRHLELYLAVPAMGAVLHTLNIRLFEDDLHYIVGHAEDKRDLPRRLAGRRDAAVRGRRARGPDARRPTASATARWTTRSSSPTATRASSSPTSTRTAPRPCATRAGRPGGRRASSTRTARRSCTRSAPTRPTASGCSERDSVMPVVPMFHANAWGLPYAAAMAGARQVLPGPRMTPADLAELIADEHVTFTARRPDDLAGHAALDPPPDLSSLERDRSAAARPCPRR